jgi:hypothetical protein
MAKKLVKNYSFTPGVSVDANIAPDAYSLILVNRTFVIKEIVAYIQNKVTAGDSSYVGYVFSTVKCERDSGYVMDALLNDIRYGGNEEISYVASQYWDGIVPQIDGNRIPEYEAYEFAADLITNYILPNVVDTTPQQGVTIQTTNLDKVAEEGVGTRVITLLTNIKEVIENGLGSLPVLSVGLARLEILGKVELEELLLISNVTDNAVMYNFSDPSRGATVEFNQGNSPAYPNALQVNNGTTFIRFKLDTSSMSASDNLQIFLESTEIKTRPYDFGTDAIERMRVAQPQAMLDADFEYGLQPTKWQAIGTQRGYPSTYELTGTDIPVLSISTDASTGTANIGGSLITVTTVAAHGLSVGGAFSIRALASSITGFARAEGTFIVYSVTSGVEFSYYAKAKVGTSNGQILAASSTQLRKAEFYTGAAVGAPIFSVASNGSSGSFTTALKTVSGQNTLSFIGAVPPVGAPLTGTGINSGTQITGSFGNANSDGIEDYRYVATTFIGGATSVELTDVSGLSAGMAVGNLASPNVLLEITSIAGSTLNLNGAITLGRLGDATTYTGGAINLVSTGTSCTLNISVTTGTYSVTSIAAGGSGYADGDTLKILGTAVGGTSPAHDFYVNVSTVSAGAVQSVTIIEGGGDIALTNTYSTVATQGDSGRGTGAVFQVNRANGSYTLGTITGSMNSYYVGNRLRIFGSSLDGSNGPNDAAIIITGVTAGSINTAAISGTATRGEQIPVYSTVTISEATTADVAVSATISYSAIATMQITFVNNHGFVPGMGINVAITSTGSGHALASGPFAVEQVVSSNVIRYVARTAGAISTATLIQGTVYVRPDTFFTHRPFDGGVQLGTGGPQHGGQAIRQSKKYIRYQSGKGAMYNTGALFAPSFDIRSVTSAALTSGSIMTVITDDVDHGVQAGATIRLSGVETTGYNGSYTVSEIIDERTFRVISNTALGALSGTIGSQCQMALENWHGAVVRTGPFDDQNGIFFQYDGQELAVCRRTSTFQIAGTISVGTDSNLVTGTNTRFLSQLQEGDRIVIRGMTHVVAGIPSDTTMTVTPDFRGVNSVSGVKVCKVQDLIIPQSDWNLDRCDGTGPSGYNIDVTKMQMVGIQFSWYGAGFIDWMFRGANGDYVFCHRLKGNNLNTEAYMRTGNSPVRYEVLNEGARGRLNGALTDSQNFIELDDVHGFPNSGTVYIDNEMISYSGKTTATNRLTGCTRAATLSNFAAGAVRTYTAGVAATHSDNQGVVLISCTTSPIISHWGSAYLIDGLFDEDRGYIFNYAATGISASVTKQTAFLIRLAPSVSNAVTGDLGERELLNRAQLLLSAIAVASDSVVGGGAIVIEGILNPQNYPTNPTLITWNGLNTAAAGGQPSFAQVALGGSVNWGASLTTQTATVAGAVSATVSAVGVAVTTVTVTAIAGNIPGFTTHNPALIVGRNYFWITNTQYDALTTTIQVGDRLSATTYITSNQTITQITRNYNSGGYTLIVMNAQPNTNSPNSTNITVTVTSAVSSNYNSAIRSGQTDFLITNSERVSSGIAVGDRVSATNYSSQTIVSITTNFITLAGTVYSRIVGSINATGTSTAGTNVTVTAVAAQTAASYTGVNYLFFTSGSYISSGATVSTLLDSATMTQFPAGTSISAVSTRALGGTTVYRVTFTQSSNTSIAAAATVTFTFGYSYAVPGEQVFSFISTSGTTDTLNLEKLKELGTTAIGGRGTFPNGPDVLAINVYKTSGTATPVNIILRWGEAQA